MSGQAIEKRRIGLPFGITLALGASAAPAHAAFTRQIAADYTQFAACAFQLFDEACPSMVRLTDLRGTDTSKVRIEQIPVGLGGSTTNRFVDMDVRRAGSAATMSIKPTWTVFGDDFYSERTWNESSSCLPPKSR